LQNIRVRDLRRTVGSWLAQAGVSLHLIGDVLNHRDLRTTLGYAYFQTQQQRDALAEHGNKILSFAAAQLRVALNRGRCQSRDFSSPSVRPRVIVITSSAKRFTSSYGQRLFQKLHGGSAYRTSGWRSCADGQQSRRRDGATGLGPNPVKTSTERLCWRRLKVAVTA
jgi:hypothetical protein